MIRCVADVYLRMGLKVNAEKTKVKLLGGKEGLVCEVIVVGKAVGACFRV